MMKSADSLTVITAEFNSSDMFLAHGIHRICECIRIVYSTVDELFATVKQVFLKAPGRVIELREISSDLPLPSQ